MLCTGKIDVYIIILPLVVHIEQVLNCGGGVRKANCVQVLRKVQT